MTDPSGRVYYWDADVCLSYFAATPGRLPTLDALLVSAGAGEIEIVTSVITISEVAFVEAGRTRRRLDPAVEAAMDALWGSSIRLVEVSSIIALSARGLVRTSIAAGPRLKPMDTIHLATAESLHVAAMHTYDRALHQLSGRLGFPIREPLIVPSASLRHTASSAVATVATAVETDREATSAEKGEE